MKFTCKFSENRTDNGCYSTDWSRNRFSFNSTTCNAWTNFRSHCQYRYL